jgi:cell division protein FtsN
MNSKMLVLAAIGIVVATSLVMVGTITVHSAEASGPGCPNKRAATAIVDPNAPNAVNTQIPATSQPQLAGQTV